jgi:hypothetical protein
VNGNQGSNARLRVILVGLVAGLVLQLQAPREASAEPALSALIMGGVDQDTTAIGRLIAGAIYGLPFHKKLAVEGHVATEVFLRIDNAKGISAKGLTLLDLGFRYGIKNDRFVGPYVTAGGSFGIFIGKPHERRVDGEAETCASANIPADQPQDRCTFSIDKNLMGRLGFGWGFRNGKKTTVGIRLDLTYMRFSLNDYDPDKPNAPIPRHIPRPQDSFAVMLGLEFLRWR